MEDSINLKISADNIDTEIKIDNSTNFKDFTIEIKMEDEIKNLDIQIDFENKILYIDEVKFNGITLELLKSFLNQLP